VQASYDPSRIAMQAFVRGMIRGCGPAEGVGAERGEGRLQAVNTGLRDEAIENVLKG
jgi:hypothetical protein